jgi:hypothetical protein
MKYIPFSYELHIYEVFTNIKSEIRFQISQDLNNSGVGELNQNNTRIEIKEKNLIQETLPAIRFGKLYLKLKGLKYRTKIIFVICFKYVLISVPLLNESDVQNVGHNYGNTT